MVVSSESSSPGVLVLLSGGLDSAVLGADLARSVTVTPVYVSTGLAWEAAELAVLDALLRTPPFAGRVEPLTTLALGMRDVYAPTHWAITGRPPAYDTPDEDVYLAGRNLVLLTKAGVVAAGRRLTRIALGPLAGNPFPDATPAFFRAMSQALSLGLDHPIEVITPFATLKKADVIRIGHELGVAFELTMSCMNPQPPPPPAGGSGALSPELAPDPPRAGADALGTHVLQAPQVPLQQVPVAVHCGLCSKCRERRDAFEAAGVDDPTPYANPSPRLRQPL